MENAAKILKYIHLGEGIEKKGINFYSNAYKRVIDPNSKALLKFLIGEEKIHLNYFLQLERKVRKGKTDGKMRRLKNPIFNKAAYKRIKGNKATLFNIFNAALEIETKSIRLYSSIGKKVKDKKLKRLMGALVAFETNHYRLIKMHKDTLYNFLYWTGRKQARLET